MNKYNKWRILLTSRKLNQNIFKTSNKKLAFYNQKRNKILNKKVISSSNKYMKRIMINIFNKTTDTSNKISWMIFKQIMSKIIYKWINKAYFYKITIF
jgi:F0F1-type ATP synthase gamma subunit